MTGSQGWSIRSQEPNHTKTGLWVPSLLVHVAVYVEEVCVSALWKLQLKLNVAFN